MSLFNNSDRMAREKEAWREFEMEHFEPLLTENSPHQQTDLHAAEEADEKNRTDFTSLERGEREKGDFIFLKEDGDTYRRKKAAEDVLREAQKKVPLLEQEAYEKGFAQGEKDGLELGEKKALKVIENIENLFSEMCRLKKDMVKRYEVEILELIFAIVKKIIGDEAESNQGIIKGIVIKALDVTAEKNEITVRVNPDDFDFVERLRPEFFAKFRELKTITVTSDSSISRGGCFLESPCGDVDATIETRLEKIYGSLDEVRKLET